MISQKPTQPLSPNFVRGQIWMVDFGQPVGSELGLEHPALIISCRALNEAAQFLRKLVVVPATSTQIAVKGKTISMHEEVFPSEVNGLIGTTYFMSEQIRSASTTRFRRLMGTIERTHLRNIEDKLCEVLSLNL